MMQEYKEYVWCTSDGIIRNILMRETPAYLITQDGTKYKKGSYSNGAIAARRTRGDRYRSSTYYAHALDCPTVAIYKKKQHQKHTIYAVKSELKKVSDNIETYEQALEVGRKLQGWTKVSDKLPEKSQDVLCLLDYGEGPELRVTGYWCGEGTRFCLTWDQDGEGHHVTHWAPLLDFPKVDK